VIVRFLAVGFGSSDVGMIGGDDMKRFGTR
jgi:hypothetical protein